MAYLIPNGNVRMEVMGLDPRPASDDELRSMQNLVREGMDAGAVGLSTGLDYIPSLYADAREIAALCEPIVAENGVYVTHMRGYGPAPPSACTRSTISPARPASRPTSRTTTARPISCSR